MLTKEGALRRRASGHAASAWAFAPKDCKTPGSAIETVDGLVLYQSRTAQTTVRGVVAEAKSRGIKFARAALRKADLHGLDLSGMRLDGSDLRGADLRRADLNYASVKKADLRDADMTDAKVYEANFKGADLRGVVGAKLDKAVV